MLYRISLVTFCMLASVFLIQAQSNRKGIEWTLKEKFKIDPAVAKEAGFFDDESVRNRLEGMVQYTDVPIVSSSNIDAEVHASVNPLDSQNILASPIRQSSFSISTPIYYTKNFGGTWTKSTFNPMPAVSGGLSMGGGDPVLAFDANGRAYFSWLELFIKTYPIDTVYWGLYWAYSDDGGATWIRPPATNITLSKLDSSGYVDKPVPDKQWMAIDRSSSQFRNNLYMSYAQLDLNAETYTIVVQTKPADSAAFNPDPVPVSDTTFTLVQFTSLDVDIQGNVHVSFFGTKNDYDYGIYYARSTDGGLTFSVPALVTPLQFPRFSGGQLNETVVGISDDRLYPACYLAANTQSQDIYLTWTANGIASKLTNGLDIYFVTSADGGLTWSTPKVVNDDQGNPDSHQYYSSISCGPEGNVLLGWYDRRDDTLNIIAHYYFSESFDHGNTFTPSYQVTTAGTDFSKVGISNNNFGIGEYTQILGVKDHIIPVWTDGRTNNGNLNIYVAFINRKTMEVEQITGVNRNLGIIAIYPNPAGERVNVSFSLGEDSQVGIYLFDPAGRMVADLHQGCYNPGDYSVSVDLSGYVTGRYFLTVTAGTENFSRKIILSR